MSTDESREATAPADLDTLAAFYFKDRDVACERCGYNRRDSTTAACPECGAEAWVSYGVQPEVRLIRSTITFVAIAGIVVGIVGLLSGLTMVPGLASDGLDSWTARWLAISATQLACLPPSVVLLRNRSDRVSGRTPYVSTQKLVRTICLLIAGSMLLPWFISIVGIRVV